MSTQNKIFYYPYASMTDSQAPLLKAAALYFDKLFILDPEKASWGTIGAGDTANDIKLLEDERILERVSPDEVLSKLEKPISDAIKSDVNDPDFIRLCESSGKAQQWTLALAKIPKDIREDPEFKPLDRSMQRLMSDVPRSISEKLSLNYSGTYSEATDFLRYSEQFVYIEDRQGIEYRYADFPLPIGEAIMMNHALFGSLLYSGATPLTDDTFHNKVLEFKINKAKNDPKINQILESQIAQRQIKHDLFSASALKDTQLNLPALSSQVHLEEILEYRNKHSNELMQAREELGWIAREIESTPWSKEFVTSIESKSIPKLHKMLENVSKSRDSWIKTGLKTGGLVAGAVATALTLVFATSPLLPISVATAMLGLTGDQVLPGIELILDWKKGKKHTPQNGLHYFLKI